MRLIIKGDHNGGVGDQPPEATYLVNHSCEDKDTSEKEDFNAEGEVILPKGGNKSNKTEATANKGKEGDLHNKQTKG